MTDDKTPDDVPAPLALASGYSIHVATPDRECVEVRAPDGRMCVSIRLTEAGPVVEIDAASLRVASRGELALTADRVSIEGARELSLSTPGDLTLHAGGALRSTAFEQRIEATRGDVAIEANDDVKLDGERIRLNAPNLPALRRAAPAPPAPPSDPGSKG